MAGICDGPGRDKGDRWEPAGHVTGTYATWRSRRSTCHSGRMRPGADDPTSDDHADLSARIDAASALNRLSHALVGHRATPEVLQRIASAADDLAARIEQEPVRERSMEIGASPRFLRAVVEPRPLADVVDGGAFLDMFEDSPVSGSANPLSIGLRIRQDGDQALGMVTLDRGWEGAPGRSHGGIVASCVDETLGGLLPVIGEMAFTGELSLRYEAPCPMGIPLEFRSWLERRDGRKLHLACTGSADGEVFVRATALFITVDLGRFRPVG